MNEQEKSATALSPLYPPIILPKNKSEWNAGHACLHSFEKKLSTQKITYSDLSQYNGLQAFYVFNRCFK